MVFKDTLPNGIRVITEEMPQAFSVTTGVWIGTGSAYEQAELAGISHFLEHMLFKGTKTRTAKEIGELMEDVGGQMNAFTSKEHTCYYVRSLDEFFELGVDVLADMYSNSTFPEQEFAKEKGVILEEINMYEDTPDDLVHEIYAAELWPQHSYGRSIIGTLQTVGDMTRDQLVEYYRETYTPLHTTIVVTGNIKREQVLEVVNRYFGGVSTAYHWDKPQLGTAEPQAGRAYVYKDIEQVHIVLGFPALAGTDENLFKLHVLSSVLGGGVTSRLFQEAREERGLTYNIYASNSYLVNSGTLYACASTSPQKVDEVLRVMATELKKMVSGGISEVELKRAQSQLKCSLLMGLENTANVMARLGKLECNYGEITPIDEMVEKIMAVTCADVQKMAEEIIVPERAVLALVGSEDYPRTISDLFA